MVLHDPRIVWPVIFCPTPHHDVQKAPVRPVGHDAICHPMQMRKEIRHVQFIVSKVVWR